MVASEALSIPFLTALAAIAASTVTDIKTHEVPDWVSYSAIILGVFYAIIIDSTLSSAVLPFVFAIAYVLVLLDDRTPISHWLAKQSALINLVVIALFTTAAVWFGLSGSGAVHSSVLGLSVGFAIGALLYYTGQWGGGDAKLLGGIGSLVGLSGSWLLELFTNPLQVRTAPFFVMFLGLIVVCGMIYGIGWMGFLIVRNWKRFAKLFSEELKRLRIIRFIVWGFVAACMIFALVRQDIIGALVLVIATIAMTSFYLVSAIRIAEKEFMLKKIKGKLLTPGDWVVDGIKIKNKWIIPKENLGATKEQIEKLRKIAPNKIVVIKEGIPFVPSFLAAFIIALIL